VYTVSRYLGAIIGVTTISIGRKYKRFEIQSYNVATNIIIIFTIKDWHVYVMITDFSFLYLLIGRRDEWKENHRNYGRTFRIYCKYADEIKCQ